MMTLIRRNGSTDWSAFLLFSSDEAHSTIKLALAQKNLSLEFPIRSYKNQLAQLQRLARIV